MILVDSGVWIDQLAGKTTAETDAFERLVYGNQPLAIGDLIVAEVLQGTRDDREFRLARSLLTGFERVQISDHQVAEQAARFYRALRSRGITIRRTIDTLIATRCILDNMPLLYADRDFRPFVDHFGLQSALDLPGAH